MLSVQWAERAPQKSFYTFILIRTDGKIKYNITKIMLFQPCFEQHMAKYWMVEYDNMYIVQIKYLFSAQFTVWISRLYPVY